HHHQHNHHRQDDDDDSDSYGPDVMDLLQPPYCYSDDDCYDSFERPSEAICEWRRPGYPDDDDDGPSIVGCAFRRRVVLNGAGPGLHRCAPRWPCTEWADCQFSSEAPWLTKELGLESGLGCYANS